jgi:hypothetical protein
MFKVGDHFESLNEAKAAVKAAILDASQSFYVHKSDRTRCLLHCKTKDCPFNVRIIYSKRTELATITKYEEHQCSPATHYKNKAATNVEYLKLHHSASVIDNNDITPGLKILLILIFNKE